MLDSGRKDFKLMRHPSSNRPLRIDEAIPHIDIEYGLDIPVVVIGYGCLVRCCSVRSSNRVITHSIVNPADSQHMGNMHQMMMRAGGMTKDIREFYNFGKVKILCRDHDFQLLQRLYNFTTQVLRKAGTGSHEGLDTWTMPEYEDIFDIILQSWRKHVAPGMHKHWPIECWTKGKSQRVFKAI